MSLSDKDRIFTNLYGFQSLHLAACKNRRSGNGGPTSLLEMASANTDYRKAW
jgi:hypothetical protein